MKIEQNIPFDKEFILEKQIALNDYSEEEKGKFEKLFEILEHYFHDQGFNLIQKIKRNYAAFDPDKLEEERLKYIGKSDLSILNHLYIKSLKEKSTTKLIKLF
jgi:hypothetical protein